MNKFSFFAAAALSCCTLFGDFTIRRTDAIFRDASPVVKNISNDGKLILAYNSAPADKTVPELELFKNVDGRLVSKATLPLDKFVFPNGGVWDCFTDEKFKIFGILDNNGDTKVRLRLLKLHNGTFKVVKEVIYDDASSINLSAGITLDGKSILLFYTNNQPTTTTYTSTVKLLNRNLKTLDTFVVNGLSNSPATFVLKRKGKDINYFLLGFADINPSTFYLSPPATLQVYEVGAKKLKLIDEAALPQFPITFFADNHNYKNPNIIVGTVLALASGDVSIFQDTSDSMTFIPGNDQNIQEFVFDGKKLSLKATMAADGDIIASNFYRDGNTFGIVKLGEDGVYPSVGNMSFFKIDESNNFKSVTANALVPSGAYLPSFSKNGKFFVVGGSPAETSSGPNGIFNINLFEVTKN